VRCITNIFSGRIVAKVAAEAAGHGHRVILFTTHPEVLHGGTGIRVRLSRTFADLDALMAAEVASDGYTR
jgi:NADPH-dependent 2,4-dienoyl-CoA reductase/sulfur reductase-like enzyme